MPLPCFVLVHLPCGVSTVLPFIVPYLTYPVCVVRYLPLGCFTPFLPYAYLTRLLPVTWGDLRYGTTVVIILFLLGTTRGILYSAFHGATSGPLPLFYIMFCPHLFVNFYHTFPCYHVTVTLPIPLFFFIVRDYVVLPRLLCSDLVGVLYPLPAYH